MAGGLRAELGVAGVGAECQGEWHVRVGGSQGPQVGKGRVRVRLEPEGTAMDIIAALTPAAGPGPAVPGALSVEACELHLLLGELHFDGSASAWLLEQLAPELKKLLNSALRHEACPQLKKLAEGPASSFLRKTLAPAIRTAAAPPPDLPPPDKCPEGVQWGPGSSPLAEGVRLLNRTLAAWPGGAAGLVNEIVGPGGALHAPGGVLGQVFPLSFNSSSWGGVAANVSALSVAGLQLSALEIPSPATLGGGEHGCELEVLAALDEGAEFRTVVSLSVDPQDSKAKGPILDEAFTVHFRLGSGRFGARAAVALSEPPVHAADYQCLANRAEALEFLEMSLDLVPQDFSIVPLTSGGLENELDKLLSNVSVAIFETYDSTLAAVLQSAVGGRVRDAVNEALAGAVADARKSPLCAENAFSLSQPEEVMTSGAMDLSQSPLIQLSTALASVTEHGKLAREVEEALGSFPWKVPLPGNFSFQKSFALEGVDVAEGRFTLLGARVIGFESASATPPVPLPTRGNGSLTTSLALVKPVLEVDVSVSEMDQFLNRSGSSQEERILATVSMTMETLRLGLDFSADVDFEEYTRFNGLGPWNPLCYLNASRSLKVLDLRLNWDVSALGVNITLGDAAGRLQKGLQNMMDEVFASREGQPGMDSLVSKVVNSSAPLLNKVLDVKLPSWKAALRLRHLDCSLEPGPLDPSPISPEGVADWTQYGPYMVFSAVADNLTPVGLAEYINTLATTYGGESGSVSFGEIVPSPLEHSVPEGPWGSPVTLHVSDFSLEGLNSFSTIGPLSASNLTSVVRGSVELGNLQVRTEVKLRQETGIVGSLDLSFNAGLQSLGFQFGSQLAFDQNVLENIPWESGNASCISGILLGSAAAAQVLDIGLEVTPGNVTLMASGPSPLVPVLQDLGTVLSAEVTSTRAALSKLVQYAIQGPVKDQLNSMIAHAAREVRSARGTGAQVTAATCPSGAGPLSPKPVPSEVLVKWEESVGFGVAAEFLGYFGPENMASFVDDGLASIVGDGGVLKLEDFVPPHFGLPAGPWGGEAHVDFLHGTFEGLSRFEGIGPLQAYDGDVVRVGASLERVRLRSEMRVKQMSGLLGNGTVIVDAELDDLALATGLQVFLDKTNLGAIPWVSGNGTCISKDLGLVTHGVNILDLGVGVKLKNLTVLTSDDGNSSKMFKDLSVIFSNASQNSLGPFITGLTHFSAQGPVKTLLNSVLERKLGSGSLGSSDLEELGFLVGSECGLPAWDGTSRAWSLVGESLTILMFGSAFLALLAALCLWLFARREPKSDDASDGLRTPLLESEEESDDKFSDGGPALLRHPRVSRLGAIVFFFVLMGNFTMFVWSNAGAGASVYAFLTDTEGVQHKLALIKTFTLFGTVTDMWAAHVYALSVLIAVLSGIWPYVKLFGVALSSCLSSKWMSVERRGFILSVADALGKWSLLDAYVLMMMTVAFRLTWSTPSRYAKDPDTHPTTFDVLVQPELGCYVFLAATNLSLIVCHVASAFHRQATEPRRNLRAPKITLSEQLQYSFRQSLLITCAIVCGIGGVILASVLPSFSFTFRGLTGKLFESERGSATRNFSLLSLALEFPSDSKNLFPGSLEVLQVCLIIFSVAMPVLHLLTALLLWCVRTNPSWKGRLLMVAEITYAWSAIDVFIFTLIVSLYQIERFSLFVIGHKCDALNPALEQFSDYFEGDPRCFDVTTALLAPGTVALVIISVYYTLLGRYVMRRTREALDDRDGGLEGELMPSSPRPFRTASEDISLIAGP